MNAKHILIIGGTSGIGKTVGELLTNKHYKISRVGRRTSAKRPFWRADISKEKLLKKTLNSIIKKNGKISHLIFCQRYRGTADSWQGEFSVSLTATKNIVEFCSSHFDNSAEKSIVIINSLASFVVGLEQPLSYHVAKAGLTQLIRYYAVILGPKGIRVNSISPCTILKDESKQVYMSNPKLLSLYKRITPLGRMGTAQDIANVVEFLISPQSSFITGQNIIVDGGLTLTSQEALARDLASLPHPNYVKKR